VRSNAPTHAVAPWSHAALQHHGRTQSCSPTVARSLATPRSHAALQHHGRTQSCSPTVARSLATPRSHAALQHHGCTQHPTFARSLQPALAVICVRPHLRVFERTRDSALAVTAVICGRTCALRSTTNNWHVRTQVVRSNALQ
jgi:hypothetical protein